MMSINIVYFLQIYVAQNVKFARKQDFTQILQKPDNELDGDPIKY